MATESEQVRILRENELIQAENERMVADLEEQTPLTEQAQAAIKSLKADIEQQAQFWTLLFSDYEQERARIQRVVKVESWLMGRSLRPHEHPPSLGAILSRLQAALAGGDSDGELRPEVEARLRESLKTPREDLLTADEMRQKLENADAAHADTCSRRQIGTLSADPDCNCGAEGDADAPD